MDNETVEAIFREVEKIVREDRYDWVETLSQRVTDGIIPEPVARKIYECAMIQFGWTFNEDTGRWQ